MQSSVDLFILAQEASADTLGAELIEKLLYHNPSLCIQGIAGPKMRRFLQPTQVFLPMEDFEIMGFIDVIKALPKLLQLFKKVKQHLLALNPKAIVFIDYPGFNLRMARHLRKHRFSNRLIHYVCPSIWAWKKGRKKTLTKTLDLLLSIFPFEKPLFQQSSLHVEYVGHPLAYKIANHLHSPSFPCTSQPIFSIFPGSRTHEVIRNFPLQLKAAVELNKGRYTLAVSYAKPSLLPLIKKEISLYPSASILLFPGSDNDDLMKHSHLAFATSGTITLELALHGVPTLVTYATSYFDYLLAYHVLRIRLPHYCIANYIANQRIFPEFFGPHFNKKMIYETLTFLLNHEEQLQLCRDKCTDIKKILYQHNPSDTAASAILSVLSQQKNY